MKRLLLILKYGRPGRHMPPGLKFIVPVRVPPVSLREMIPARPIPKSHLPQVEGLAHLLRAMESCRACGALPKKNVDSVSKRKTYGILSSRWPMWFAITAAHLVLIFGIVFSTLWYKQSTKNETAAISKANLVLASHDQNGPSRLVAENRQPKVLGKTIVAPRADYSGSLFGKEGKAAGEKIFYTFIFKKPSFANDPKISAPNAGRQLRLFAWEKVKNLPSRLGWAEIKQGFGEVIKSAPLQIKRAALDEAQKTAGKIYALALQMQKPRWSESPFFGGSEFQAPEIVETIYIPKISLKELPKKTLKISGRVLGETIAPVDTNTLSQLVDERLKQYLAEGKFKGEKGEKGERGETGAQGASGSSSLQGGGWSLGYVNTSNPGGTGNGTIGSFTYFSSDKTQINVLNVSDQINVSGAANFTGTVSFATTTLGGIAYAWPGGDGSANQVLVTNGSGQLSWANISVAGATWSTSTNGSIYYSSGNVGIGTSGPVSVLHVVGNSNEVARFTRDNSTNVNQYFSITENINGTTLLANSATSNQKPLIINVANSGGGVSAGTMYTDFQIGGTSVMTLKGSNVGIGTTSPIALFNVTASTTTDTIPVFINNIGSAGGAGMLISRSSNTRAAQIQFGLGSIPEWYLGELRNNGNAVGGLSIGQGSNTAAFTPALFLSNTYNKVGINTSSPSVSLSVVASSTVDILDIASSSGASYLRVTSAGNVGIGTTSPLDALHVYKASNGNVTGLILDNDGGASSGTGQAVRFRYSATGANLGGIYNVYDGTNWYLRFKTWTGSAEQERLTIQGNTGNIGIGTTAPSGLLHIYGTQATAYIDYSSTNGFFGLKHAGVDKGLVGLAGGANNLSLGSVQDDLVIRSASGNILFSTNAGAATQMYIKNDGNVGIGTTSPSQLLTVGNNNQFTVSSAGDINGLTATIGTNSVLPVIVSCPGCTSGSGNPAGTYTYAGRYNNYNYYKLVGGNWYLWNNGDPSWRITPVLGNLSVEWYSGIIAGQIPPYTSSWSTYGGTSGTLTTSAGSSTQLVVDSSGNLVTGGTISVGTGNSYLLGNVGIGTTSPLAKLDVYGNLNVATSSTSVLFANTGTSRVGIGTSTPGDTLHIVTTSAFAGLTVQSTNDVGVNIKSQAGNGAELKFTTQGLHLFARANSSNLFIGNSGGTVEMIGINGSVSSPNSVVIGRQGAAQTIGNGTLLVYDGTAATGVTTLNIQEGAGQGATSTLSILANNGTTTRLTVLGTSGNVGIGTGTPLASLHVQGSGSSNMFTISSSTGAHVLTVFPSGNIGIGAVGTGNGLAPNSKLYITYADGSSNSVTNGLTLNNIAGQPGNFVGMRLGLYSGNDTSQKQFIGAVQATNGSGGTGDIVFLTITNGGSAYQQVAAADEKMRITNYGNVGIGTTSPQTALHVASSGSTTLRIDGGATSLPQIQFTQGSNLRGYLFYDNTYGLMTLNRTGNSGSGLVVNASDNVGIGTSSPIAKLDVYGNLNVATSSTSTFYVNTATGKTSINALLLPTLAGGGMQCLRVDNSGNVITAGIDCGASGGSLAGGVKGYVATWASSTGLTVGTLIDNGTVSGVNATSSTVSFLVQGTGTLNPFQVNSSTGTSLLTVTPSGNVGIGTTAPNYLQENYLSANGWGMVVTRASGASVGLYVDTTGGYLQTTGPKTLGLGANGGSAITILNGNNKIGFNNSSPTYTVDIKGSGTIDPFNVASSSGTSLMVITNQGNVGIGTTDPAKILDIQAPTADTQIKSTTSTNYVISRWINGNNQLQIGLDRSTGGIFGTGSLPYAAAINVWQNYPLQFGTNSVMRMTIEGGGNVGIGTTSPSALLHVGGGSVRGTFIVEGSTADIPYIQLKDGKAGGKTWTMYSGLNNAGDFALYDNSAAATPFTVKQSTGNVGIGTTSPATLLHMEGASAQLRIATNNDSSPRMSFYSGSGNVSDRNWMIADGLTTRGALEFKVGSASGVAPATDVMSILSNGNVGIGTTGPSHKLHVAGTGSTDSYYGLARFSPSAAGGESEIGFFDDVAGTDTNDAWVIGQGGWSNTGDFIIGNENNGAGGNVRLLIEKSGNVGIGTTSPATTLDVNGTTTMRGALLFGTDNTWDIGASGANRPRNLYLSNALSVSSITAAATVGFGGGRGGAGAGIANGADASVYATAGKSLELWADATAGRGIEILTGTGNVGVGTTTPTLGPLTMASGAYVTAGGTWTNASDRNLKENFASVTPASILEKIVNLPIAKWNYKREDASITHLGPTAQDFYASFGLGGSDTAISTIDPSGVALVGIKALDEKINSLQQTVSNLQNTGSDVDPQAPIVFKTQVYLSQDSVGQAKILAGSKRVKVTFTKPYEYQPIVTATPLDFVSGAYRIASTTAEGFTIELKYVQDEDVTFNFHAFASPEAKLTVSDGQVLGITLTLPFTESGTNQPAEVTPSAGEGVGQEESAPSQPAEAALTPATEASVVPDVQTEPAPESEIVVPESQTTPEEITPEPSMPPAEQPTNDIAPQDPVPSGESGLGAASVGVE